MPDDPSYDFTDAALIGNLVSVTPFAALVDRGIISVSDAVEIFDDALFQLEEWQSLFPEHRQGMQFVIVALIGSLFFGLALLRFRQVTAAT